MGSVCCCWRDEFEDFAHSNNSACGNVLCIRCFVQNFLHLHTSLFGRDEEQEIALSTNGTTSLSSSTSTDSSLVDMYHSPPRPLPYDDMVVRHEKGSSDSHKETQPLMRREIDEESSESFGDINKLKNFTHEEGLEESNLKSTPIFSTSESMTGFAHINTYSGDEDDCPTCLEGYTTENPKIITKCSHHFHLGCIYEWMERSDNCPVCGKVMAFDETT